MSLKAKAHMYHASIEMHGKLGFGGFVNDRIMASGDIACSTIFEVFFFCRSEYSKESLFEIQSSSLGASLVTIILT
jgi:hypothetical protein